MNNYWPLIYANIIKAKSLFVESLDSPTIDNIQAQIDNEHTVLEVSANTQLNDSNKHIVVTATGKVLTLPEATLARVGFDWTITLGVDGICTVDAFAGDAFILSTVETSILFNTKGMSITFKCTAVGTWSLI